MLRTAFFTKNTIPTYQHITVEVHIAIYFHLEKTFEARKPIVLLIEYKFTATI